MRMKMKKMCVKAAMTTLVELLTRWRRQGVTDRQLAESVYNTVLDMLAEKRGNANA